MYYYIYAEKDATIYSEIDNDWSKKNTGLDEIIELHKKVPPVSDTIENSRILLKFDITEVATSMDNNIIPTTEEGTSVGLKLYTARPSQLPLSYTIESYPISQSWSMGIGKKYYKPALKDGVSWRYKTSETVGDLWQSSSYGIRSTSSYGSMEHGGGNWYTYLPGWDLTALSYTTESLSTTSINNSPKGFFWKPDGTKFFIIGSQSNKEGIYEYDVSQAWNASTATYTNLTSHSFAVTSNPVDVSFNTDGSIVYWLDNGTNALYQLNLGTAWDITTVNEVGTKTFSTSNESTSPSGFFFKSDGTKMYLTEVQYDTVVEYNLTTAWDISTLTNYQSYKISESLANNESSIGGITFHDNGKKMYSTGNEQDSVYQHNLSTAWDISTATFHTSRSVVDEESQLEGVHWKPDGSKMYIVGYGGDDVTQYDIIPANASSSGESLQNTQTFEFESADVNMDVSSVYNSWYSKIIPNDGLIIKRTDSDEQSSANQGILTFFSRDTHTIYPPRLEFKWDDSTWNTGSSTNTEIDLGKYNPVIYMKGRGRTFKELSKVKFRVYTRDKYKTQNATIGKYEMFKHHYLPSGSSYYSIKDTVTEETIIPFSDESKLSADDTSNYFNIWMNGLQPERYYRVVIKAVSGSGTTGEIVNFYDDKFTFKVER